MSVDDRLREAFGASAGPMWEPDPAAALRAVTDRRSRERALKRSGISVLGLAAATALVAALAAGPGDPEPTGDLDPTVPPGDVSSTEYLEGVWRTDRVTTSDVRDALTSSGNAEHEERFLSRLPTPFRLEWTIQGGLSQLRVIGRKEQFVLDDEIIAVSGDRLVLSPRYATGESVHQIVAEGDLLRLDFVSTTESSSGGLPGDVWHRVLYDSVDFTRQ